MAPPLTFKTNKTMAIKKAMGPGPKKATAKKPLTKAQEFKKDPEMAMKKYYTGGAGVKLPVDRQAAVKKAKSNAAFNASLVQGGSKNPAFSPEKYYPSLYGKGRVGDKVGSAMKITSKKTVTKKK